MGRGEKPPSTKGQFWRIGPPRAGLLICLSAFLQFTQWAMVIWSRPIGSLGSGPIPIALWIVEIRDPFGFAASTVALLVGLWAAVRAAFQLSDALEAGGTRRHTIWPRILMLVVALCCLSASVLLMRYNQKLWTE